MGEFRKDVHRNCLKYDKVLAVVISSRLVLLTANWVVSEETRPYQRKPLKYESNYLLIVTGR